MDNTYQFQGILRILIRTRARKDRQTNQVINTFNLVGKSKGLGKRTSFSVKVKLRKKFCISVYRISDEVKQLYFLNSSVGVCIKTILKKESKSEACSYPSPHLNEKGGDAFCGMKKRRKIWQANRQVDSTGSRTVEHCVILM